MRSTNQRDIFRDDPRRLAEANRAAAETALIDVQFSERERIKRHAHYMAEAAKYERAT